MFDPITSSQQHKTLLHNILFLDSSSVQYWFDYIRYLTIKDDNFNSICRLFNFTFTLIDQPENYQHENFIQLCLFKASYFG
jgi:hypothetical protein